MTSDQAIEIVQSIRVQGLFNNRLPVTIKYISQYLYRYITIQIWVADKAEIVNIDIVGKGERELIQEIFERCLRILTVELQVNFNSPT